MNKPRKAVFPVAEFGSRFPSATKAMPKELLPIVNKPLIKYASAKNNRDIELIFPSSNHTCRTSD